MLAEAGKKDQTKLLIKRILLNIVMIGILVASCFAIISVVESFLDEIGFVALVPSLVLAIINARCPFLDRNSHSRSVIEFHGFAPLKRSHACDQWHSSRVFILLTGWHCKFRPNAEGRHRLHASGIWVTPNHELCRHADDATQH